jgi:hypothetical protein
MRPPTHKPAAAGMPDMRASGHAALAAAPGGFAMKTTSLSGDLAMRRLCRQKMLAGEHELSCANANSHSARSHWPSAVRANAAARTPTCFESGGDAMADRNGRANR